MRTLRNWIAGLLLGGSLASVGCTIPPGPPPGNLLSGLCPTKEQIEKAQDEFCKCPLGQLAANSMKPLSVFTGGIGGDCCPPFKNEDLLKPATSAEGAAGRIQAEEAAAKARRAAIRYLGTVDCRYWPDARDAMINGLRGDTNECVRWEAAMVMGSGCCCNKEILRALAICVSGSDADGNPPEVSQRVRDAAAISLDRCLACVGAVVPPVSLPEQKIEEKPPETPPETPPDKLPDMVKAAAASLTAPATVTPASGSATATATPATPASIPAPAKNYYHRLDKVPMDQVVREARLAIEKHPVPAKAEAPKRKETGGLFEVIARASQTTSSGSSVQNLLADLRQGNPEVRKKAVLALATVSWNAHPEIIDTLAMVAREDSDAGVRITTVRALARMDVTSSNVIEALQYLESDANPTVKAEASQALLEILKRATTGDTVSQSPR